MVKIFLTMMCTDLDFEMGKYLHKCCIQKHQHILYYQCQVRASFAFVAHLAFFVHRVNGFVRMVAFMCLVGIFVSLYFMKPQFSRFFMYDA